MPACNLDSDHDRDGTGVSEPMLSKIENAQPSSSRPVRERGSSSAAAGSATTTP